MALIVFVSPTFPPPPQKALRWSRRPEVRPFPPSYRRAGIMQAILAALGLLCSVAAWFAGATFWWIGRQDHD